MFKPAPNDNILDVAKLKAFAHDKFNITKVMISLFDRIENIVVKGENTGYQQFPFFQCFQRACFPGASKGVIVWEWVKGSTTVAMCLRKEKKQKREKKMLVSYIFFFPPF